MLFSFEVIVASVILLLPGFVTAGVYRLMLRSQHEETPDVFEGLFLAFVASVVVQGVNLLLLDLQRMSLNLGVLGTWRLPSLAASFAAFRYKQPAVIAFSRQFVVGVLVLLAIGALLGVVVMLLRQAGRRVVKKFSRLEWHDGTVWQQAVSGRTQAQNVVVLLPGRAYRGQLKGIPGHVHDPHLYLTHVELIPVPEVGPPDFGSARPLNIDKIVLDRTKATEVWFLKD